MKVYAILLLVIHTIFAKDVETFNVGTVLFSPKELKKDAWKLPEVGLLRARRYFQYVLPPPSLIDPSINNFADSILDYFTDAINVIKREEPDLLSTDILNAAIFDAIGGYMKSYILPVTKYSYYGGTVTQDDAQKLYQFYDDIKAYLRTDGTGWRSFDGSFQKPLRIIAPRESIRATRASCDQLAFYEETPSGFTIPLPSINFDNQTPVMFVPLKGHPLICLHSPSSSDTLFNYYHAAKNCLKTRSPNSEADFDNRFRSWLTDDVIAHLDDDDHLYYALGGILTLANDAAVCNTTPSKVKSPSSLRKPYIHINFGSKKIMILAVILFLEVLWCIPAIIYMLYTRSKRKKKVKEDSSKSFFFIKPNRDADSKFLDSSYSQTRSSLSSCDETTCDSVRKFKKKYCNNIQENQQFQKPSCQNFESQTSRIVSKCSKGTSNQSCFCAKQCSTEFFDVENERLTKPMRSSLKKHSTPVFGIKSSNFERTKMFDLNMNATSINKTSDQDIFKIKSNVNENSRRTSKLTLNSRQNTASKPKDYKSNENVLCQSVENTNIWRAPRDQAPIQIDSNNNIGRVRTSNKNLKSQRNSNEMSNVCKFSEKNIIPQKTNTDIIISQQSQNNMGITHKYRHPTYPDTHDEINMPKTNNSAIAVKKTEGATRVSDCHENRLNIQKSRENLPVVQFQGNAINTHQYRDKTVNLSKDDDARIEKKLIHDVIVGHKPEDALINQNNSNDDLSILSKSDDNAIILSNIDETSLGDRTDTEITSHIYNENTTILRNDTAIVLQKSREKTQFLSASQDALAIITNLDHKAKILQKSTQELIQLIDENRSKPCGNPICDCTCCSVNRNESYTSMQELRTCATITLIADDDSSGLSVQSMKTICSESPEHTLTPLSNPSRPLINTSLMDRKDPHQTKSGIRPHSGSMTPTLKPTKVNLEATVSKPNEKDKNKDSTNIIQQKVEKSTRNYGFKVTGRKFFEVKIEKPHTTISVDIAKSKRKPPNTNTNTKTNTNKKTSKIPTRVKDGTVRFETDVGVISIKALEVPTGSRIPIPVKKTVDDIVIKNSRNKGTTPDPRLNLTL